MCMNKDNMTSEKKTEDKGSFNSGRKKVMTAHCYFLKQHSASFKFEISNCISKSVLKFLVIF